MHPAIRWTKHPDARLPLAAAVGAGLMIGFVVGVFAVRSPEHTYLLREIRDSMDSHSCSGWTAQDAQGEEVYRAVSRALLDWEASGKRQPGS